MTWGMFPGKCPHCGIRQVKFEILTVIPLRNDDSIYSAVKKPKDIFAVCENCQRGVAGQASMFYEKKSQRVKFSDVVIFSFRSNPFALEHIPPIIRDNFMEGEETLWDSHYNAAGMVFRKALEMGMKNKLPKFEGRLEEFIDKAQEEDLLTKDMANWAHKIRSIGNEAAHEIEFSKKRRRRDANIYSPSVALYVYASWHDERSTGEKRNQISKIFENTGG